ncbi:sulfotransferase family protein [Actinoallomurus rhizosphaericola]|uniref:sulfotransferase family protein n=1 Tax=Actinoallomurus rhizosphaericola TaxID=2952536 RepID=UPI002093DE1E|nr:sulfotransferase family protein [Actinoallomurus rhizosphaericola]MCO5995374.1 sulfotransferase family protein [Actinoallomurus rhizosphaericola]
MLKLINAGLGRTGTTSLKVALERLGYGPCYHMFDIVGSEERLGQWEKIVCDGRLPDWKAVFDGYTSAVDGPSAIYYRQLMEAFPEAKMILTVRDAERWYRSTYDTLFQFALKSEENPPPAGSRQARTYRVTNTMTWSGLFDGRFSDKEHAIEVFHRHNQEVIRSVGADNLLVYDVKQGWEPLCAYLGVDVPSEEFPHANDSASMRNFLRQGFGVAGPAAAGR